MNDITMTKARRLVNACNGLGLQARLHWDRSPWCCQVALRQTEHFDEYSPSIFWMLEDTDSYRIAGGHGTQLGWLWRGQLQIDRDTDSERDYDDLNFEIPERNHLMDDEHTVARKVALLLSLLDVNEALV